MLDEVAEGVLRLLFRCLAEILFEVLVELLFRGALVPLGWGVARALTLGRWPPQPASENQLTACGCVGLLTVLVGVVLLYSVAAGAAA